VTIFIVEELKISYRYDYIIANFMVFIVCF